ncbi:MAG: GGDEF domain-containing protein [Rhodospirillaceae bacterium]|nr:GGDEF domain-containing protein [Rhodospirillaceae bacterium]MBL6940679.1 GGDEF domain-containing protein [Rhodospirillales bacterium]
MLGFRKSVSALLAPALLVVLSLGIAGGHVALSVSLKDILPNIPYVLTLLALLLGLWFKRERVIFSALPLGFANLAMLNAWPQVPASGPMWQIAYPALCLFLPVYLLSVAFFRDCGLLSLSGLVRVLWLFLPFAAVLVAVDDAVSVEAQAQMAAALHFRPFSTDLDFWSHLPQPAILLFGGATLILCGRFIFYPTPMEGAMLGTMASAWAALHHVGDGVMASLLLSTALLLLIVAVVQDAYHMAFLDELTGLPARRAMNTQLGRLGKRFSVAMVDVDHFKKFNDAYGHDVGDQVLQMVAMRMARVTGGGRAFRYGGEEFAVLFPGKDVEAAKEHLEALRQAIADSSFALRAEGRPETAPKGRNKPGSGKKTKTVSVTVSMGVAGQVEGIPDPDDVLKAADKALYKAKENGRNRLVSDRPTI